jgi:UDP-N-acetylmuramoyl-tripeptide--D-alanyl-D-alanine ligase
MRSQILVHHGVRLINDCYNANPASMQAALLLLAQLGAGGRTIAVLGDMLELGPDAARMHRTVGAFLVEQRISRLIACGPLAREMAQGAREAGMPADSIVEVSDAATAGSTLKSMVRKGDVVLVKASRGMRMEQAVESLMGMRRAASQAS